MRREIVHAVLRHFPLVMPPHEIEREAAEHDSRNHGQRDSQGKRGARVRRLGGDARGGAY